MQYIQKEKQNITSEFYGFVKIDFAENDARVCLQLEKIDKDMFEYGFQSVEEVQSVMKQLVTSVKHLNEMGIIHNDLKLQNVMIQKKEDKLIAKIIDFGEPILFVETKSAAKPTGTPFYWSPELYSDEKYVHVAKADIWGLGMMYVELIKRQRDWIKLKELIKEHLSYHWITMKQNSRNWKKTFEKITKKEYYGTFIQTLQGCDDLYTVAVKKMLEPDVANRTYPETEDWSKLVN